eukprot:GDKI01042125.1.p3 GENE.GDKI01042125.1~~GDKI01042125.1.p3  ORF type:complete len:104 (-),score=18.21 GDKI01042125.1:223-534(-)
MLCMICIIFVGMNVCGVCVCVCTSFTCMCVLFWSLTTNVGYTSHDLRIRVCVVCVLHTTLVPPFRFSSSLDCIHCVRVCECSCAVLSVTYLRVPDDQNLKVCV